MTHYELLNMCIKNYIDTNKGNAPAGIIIKPDILKIILDEYPDYYSMIPFRIDYRLKFDWLLVNDVHSTEGL